MNIYDLAECRSIMLRRPRWVNHSCVMMMDDPQSELCIFLLAPGGKAIGDVWRNQWSKHHLNWHSVAYMGLAPGDALDVSEHVFDASSAGAAMTLLLNYLETQS